MGKEQHKRADDELMKLIIGRLKELRSELNYSQEYVIEHTKLNISQYEANIYSPSLTSLSILCKFYHITLSEFFAPIYYPPKE